MGMRVLQMIGSLNIGGSQTMIMDVYRHIDRDRIQFDFILDHPEQLYYADEVRALGGKIYAMPTFKGYNILEIQKAWRLFFRQHPEYKILHSHVRSYASLYIPIAKKHGIATIIHSHSISNGSGIQSIVKQVMQYPLRYQADYFMACSEKAGRWLFGKNICQGNSFEIFPNALDIAHYGLNNGIREQYRQKFGIEDKIVYGHVGRLHEAKNHMFLIEVFAELFRKDGRAFLLLVGDGDLRQELEKRAYELHIQDRILFLGNRCDVAECLWSMDVFLFPSKWEGLPISVLEAQAAGLPCFVSNTVTKEVGVSDLVKYLPIDSPDVWVQAISVRSIERKDVSDNIKAAGYDIYDSVERITKTYLSMGGEREFV